MPWSNSISSFHLSFFVFRVSWELKRNVLEGNAQNDFGRILKSEKANVRLIEDITEETEKAHPQEHTTEELGAEMVDERVVEEDIWEAVKHRKRTEKGKHKAGVNSNSIDGDARSKDSTRARSGRSDSHSSTGPAQYTYSSFSFPPSTLRERKSSPHHLGDAELPPPRANRERDTTIPSKDHQEHHHHRDKERAQRDKDLGALVQAHRNRDREQAKQSEREHREGRKLGKEEEYVLEASEDVHDVVHELERAWEKSLKKNRGRGRGASYGYSSRSKTGRPRVGGSDATSDADTMVEFEGRS